MSTATPTTALAASASPAPSPTLSVPALELPRLRPNRTAIRGRHRRMRANGRNGERIGNRPARRNDRLSRLAARSAGAAADERRHAPPDPPLKLTPALACDPQTAPEILWHIARTAPELRRWLVANPRSTPELLEYVAQAGGPGVHEAIEVLLDLIERQQRHATRQKPCAA